MKHLLVLSCLGISVLSLSSYVSASSPVDTYPGYGWGSQYEAPTPMTKITFESQQRDLFSSADLNNDSQVSFEETQDILIKQQRNMMKQQFDQLDKDYSGYLTESEMGFQNSNTAARITDSVDYEKQVDAALEQFDTDKNGSVSKDEMLKGIRAQAEKHINKSVGGSKQTGTNPYFLQKDTDKSGGISFEEYTSQINNWAKRAVFQPVFMRDKNGDGNISYSENETFITDIFEALDQDDDGQLSVKEQMNGAMQSIKTIHVGAQGMVVLQAYGATHIDEVQVPGIQP